MSSPSPLHPSSLPTIPHPTIPTPVTATPVTATPVTATPVTATPVTATRVPSSDHSLPPILPDARLLTVLRPLSTATGTLLAPLKIFRNDRLSIDIDPKDSRRFHIRIHTDSPDRPPSGTATSLLKRIPEGYSIPGETPFFWSIAGTDTNVLVLHHAWGVQRINFLSDDARALYEATLLRFLSQARSSSLVANFKIEKTSPLMPLDFVEHPEPNLRLLPHQRIGVMCLIDTYEMGLFMEQGTGKTPLCVAATNLEAGRKRSKLIRSGQILTGRFTNPSLPYSQTAPQAAQNPSPAPRIAPDGTIAVLDATHPDTRETEMFRLLVVCPRQVRTNWAKEFSRFSTSAGKTTILRGSQQARSNSVVEAMMHEAGLRFTVVITSYESVDKTWEAISLVPWDRVILDESHKIKSPKTSRFKTMKRLREHAEKVAILTGTPIANSIMDLWAQLEFLGDGLSGFLSFENFRKFYGTWKKIGEKDDDDSSGDLAEPSASRNRPHGGVEKLVAIKNIPLIQERLARLTFMVTKEEAGLNLPDKVLDIVEVPMTPLQKERYSNLRDQMAAEIASDLEDETNNKTITAEHILTKLLRLSQITSGFVKYDNTYSLDTGVLLKEGEVENLHDVDEIPKIKALLGLLQDPDRPAEAKAIVWHTWKQDRANISAALTRHGIQHRVYWGKDAERDKAVQDFNLDPDVKVIICSPKTASEGLNLLGYDYDKAAGADPDSLAVLGGNLATYCDLEVFYSENWSIIERSQAESRAHRKGTKTNIRIATLCCTGTIDEEIYDRLLSKAAQATLIQDIRDILNRILRADLNAGDD